jgi:ATP-dependent helicase/nuclease subunit B
VADHPATVKALVQTGRELSDLDDAALDALATVPPLGPDLVRLHRSVVATLAARWYDQVDLLRAAVSLCRNHPAKVKEIGAVVFYLPQALWQFEAAFITALGDASGITSIPGWTSHRKADAAVRRSLDRIGATKLDAVALPTATRVLTASDGDDEVRCVVREVVDSLRTTDAHRVAVLYAAPNPYARLLHEHLAAA